MLSRSPFLASLFAAAALNLAAPVAARQQSQQQPPPPQPRFEPTLGMPGKDAVWVPTHPAVVEKMLDIASVTSKDLVVDLGSGDGRTVIAAAKRGAKAVGFEYNPDLVELSRKLANDAGVADKASFVQGDMYEADFSKATVLALFLLPGNLDKLKDKILALEPGTRVVLNTFTATGWEPDERVHLGGECTTWCEVLLHIVPARAEGTWQGRDVEIILTQAFQMVSGTVSAGGAPLAIENGRLRGERLTFTAGTLSFTGEVRGDRITGTATTTGTNPPQNWTLTRKRT
jgi:SAM-dependent methyltransferase